MWLKRERHGQRFASAGPALTIRADSGCNRACRKIPCHNDVMRRLRGHSEDTSMKAFAILPAVAAAILALDISSASSQNNACVKQYQACMDVCAGRPSKGMQDTCFTSCEGKNNLCSERIYGKRPLNGAPATTAAEGQAKDVLAKKDTMQDAPPVQAAEEPLRKEAPQAAPQQRVPAKR